MKNGISNALIAFTVLTVLLPLTGKSQNPIIQTNYTADPAPMVHNGTVYLYTTHDEDKTIRNFFTMNDWRCYSSNDMVNWSATGPAFTATSENIDTEFNAISAVRYFRIRELYK